MAHAFNGLLAHHLQVVMIVGASVWGGVCISCAVLSHIYDFTYRKISNRASLRAHSKRLEPSKKPLLYFIRSSLGSSKPSRVINQDQLIKKVHDLGGIVVDQAELSISRLLKNQRKDVDMLDALRIVV